MGSNATAYLVLQRQDGLGDVFKLLAGKRYSLGRAKTNEIVLKDDLCSRQHAEVFHAEGHWRVRDNASLNGTRVNDEVIDSDTDWELSPGDQVVMGRTQFLFVENMAQLPAPRDAPAEENAGVSIKKRMGQTRYDLALVSPATDETLPPAVGHRISRDLSLLYRLALDMGSATSYNQLVDLVLNGLLEATLADVGAILSIKEGRQLETTAHRSKSKDTAYTKVSEFVSNEVLNSKEAILAEDVARNRHLRDRESLQALGAYSLICAPVLVGDQVKALIHLYCTNPMKALDAEDLEFTVAVAKQMAVALQAVQRQIELDEENQRLKAQVGAEVELIGSSPAIREVEAQISRVAGTNATVLIRGESGVGKELVARAIHLASPRRQGPFVCLNCAALAESLLESELFGHEKGAFTGATERKIGKFEAADGGTIFLDEIGEMTHSAQAKLLRILEGHPYERVGGTEPIRVNVRVVAATNRLLEQAVNAGQFRRDLFYRLRVVEISVAPLHERRSDIPLLADYFLQRFLRETGRKIRGFTPRALEKMQAYDWPGNVRELRNVVERAVALSNGPMLDEDDIWLSPLGTLQASPRALEERPFEPMSLEEWEKRHILATLRHTDWNKSQAANILGIERSTLDRKIRAYGLQRGLAAS
jgi:transcriptional regulator with GAF, ATPase, and Fis domain